MTDAVDFTSEPEPQTDRQVFRFMDLPAELRNNFYGHCLTVGKIFYSPKRFEIREGRRFKRYQEYERPNVRVSLVPVFMCITAS